MSTGKPSIQPQAKKTTETDIPKAGNDNHQAEDPALLLLSGGQQTTILNSVRSSVSTILSQKTDLNPISEDEQSHIRLRKKHQGGQIETAPEEWRQSVLCIGDLDSDARGLLEILEQNGFIESEADIRGDGVFIEPGAKALTTTLVQTGDIFDRGDELIPTLDIFSTLKNAGTDLRLTVGNHDARALYTLMCPSVQTGDSQFYKLLKDAYSANAKNPDWDYLREIAKDPTDKRQMSQALFDAQSFWGWYRTYGRSVMKELRDRFFPKGTPPKLKNVLEKGCQLFLDEDQYANLIKDMSFLEQSDDLLFLHGGINNDLAEELDKTGIDNVNDAFRRSIGTPHFAEYSFGDQSKPLWMRHQVLTPKAAKVIKKMGIRAIVRGHDTQLNGQQLVTQEYGIHIIHNDVGISGGNRSAVDISPNGTISATQENGTPEKLLMKLPSKRPLGEEPIRKRLSSAL